MGEAWQGGSRSPATGPPHSPLVLALLAEERSQSHVLEGHVGTECLSAPLGQAGLPALRQEEAASQGPMRLGAWRPGQSAWGHARARVCWGSGRPPKERAEGAEETLETEVQPGLVAPLPGHSQQET